MLRHHRLWRTLRKKLVYAEHVRQVLDYVARNEVDVGVVYGTDFRLRKKEVVRVVTAAAASHPPILYPVAVLKGSRNRTLARGFVRLLRSDEGLRILAKHGFLPLEAGGGNQN